MSPPAGASAAGPTALWDRLTGRMPGPGGRLLPPLPQGTGPLIWMRLDRAQARDGGAPGQLAAALRAARPGLRLILTHPDAAALPEPEDAPTLPRMIPGTFGPPLPDPGASPEAAAAFLDHAAPAAVLLLGADLPDALLAEAERRGVPVVIADAALGRAEAPRRPWPWQRGRGQPLLAGVHRVLVPDTAARAEAQRLGAPVDRVEVTGPLSETRRPLGCSEAERAALGLALRGRQSWLAVGVPEAEETAVIEAHRFALGLTHRALLILSPADTARCAALLTRMEEAGLAADLRSRIDEPEGDLQVLIVDEPGELGLWYRVAAVTYIGGTLTPGTDAGRHPFEAAALGSALLHGAWNTDGPGWGALRTAHATRPVAGATVLGEALDDVLRPERAADLAARAWSVSTAGAAVVQRIAAAVVPLLPPA